MLRQLFIVGLFLSSCLCTAELKAQEGNKLDASDYHILYSGLQNCKFRFETEKKGKVAFLGGSITYNSGWRDHVSDYLEKRFPKTDFEFINAGIPSMGSTPAAFRLERDILAYGRIDLLFEEAAVNDESNGRTSDEQINAMEGIVRHLRKSNPTMDIVFMYFVDPEKIDDYREGKEPDVIKNHKKVAEYYEIPEINLAKEVADRIDNSEFTWDDDFINLHPSAFGQEIYANSIIQFLEESFNKNTAINIELINHELPYKLSSSCYDNGVLVNISSYETAKGWYIDPSWKPKDKAGVRKNYTKVPMLINSDALKPISFEFEGNAIGISVAAGPDAGIIEYKIDESGWKALNLFTPWSEQLHLPWYYTLASGMSDEKHVLEIRISEDKDVLSKGHVCRIRYFFVNRN